MTKNGLAIFPKTIMLILAAALAGGALTYWNPWVLEKIDRFMMDRYIDGITPTGPGSSIVAVLAREPSFQELGAWPWPRSVHGRLLREMGKARTIVLDLLFSETTEASEDTSLADAVGEHGGCVVAAHLSDSGNGAELQPPYKEMCLGAKSVGIANVVPDVDGLYRLGHPLWNVSGGSMPSLALAGALSYVGEPARIEKGFLHHALSLGNRKVRLDDSGGTILYPYSPGDIPTYEYVDVLKGRIAREAFRNAIVVVGINAAGLGVQDSLPVYRNGRVHSLPGALFIAVSIKNLLSGETMVRLPSWTGAILAVLAALAAGAVGTLPTALSWMAAIALSFVLLAIPRAILIGCSLWISPAGASISLAATYVMVTSMRTVSMSRSVRMGSIYTDILSSITSASTSGKEDEHSPEAILDKVWPEIEKLTSIRLLDRNLPRERALELSRRSEIIALDDSSSIIRIPGGTPPFRLLVEPAQGWDGVAVLGWSGNVSEDDLRSATAVILSVSWFSAALRRERERVTAVRGAIKAIVAAVDAKDPETRGHSERVASLSKELALEMGLSSEFIEELTLGATLHDVGKIGIPDAILQKPAKLTEEEFDRIKGHPSLGEEIMSPVNLSEIARRALLEHHEKLDGSGYPRGLSGGQISLAGRIVAVADAFDALSSRRTYKEGWPLGKILELFDQSGEKLYDPEVIRALHRVGPRWYWDHHGKNKSWGNLGTESYKENKLS